MWHDPDTWQTLRKIWSLAFGTIIGGCLMGGAQIAGGFAMQSARTARLASVVLGVVYLLFSLACIPGIIAASTTYARYASFFEQFSLLCGAIALYAATEPNTERAVVFGRLACLGLGVCAISFTLSQTIYFREKAGLVPKWIPPNQMFWAILTTIAFALATDSHSHQSPGAACYTSYDAHAGTLWRVGLDPAPARSPRGASELVRIRPDFSYYGGYLDGG
jgi:hypothetical protein